MSVFEEGPSVSKVITGGSLTFLMAMIAGVFAWIFGIVYTRADIGLGEQAYGLFITGQATITVIGCITWGINQAIQKYVAEFLVTDKEKAERYARNGVISILIFGIIVSGIVSGLGIYLFSIDPIMGLILTIIGPTVLVVSVRDGIVGNIAAIQRFDHIAVINASLSLGLFIMGVPLILFIIKPSATMLELAPLTLLGLTCSYLIQVVLSWYYARKSLPFKLGRLYRGSKDFKIIIKVFKYGVYCAIPTIILSGTILWIPALLISGILGPSAPGLLGIIVGYSVLILTISFMGWPMISAVSEARAIGDQQLIDDYFKSNFKSSFNFIALFLTILVGLAGPILTIFHGPEYAYGQGAFIILAIGVAVLALEFICLTTIIGVGEGKKASYAVITVVLSEILLTIVFLNIFPAAFLSYAAPIAIFISSLVILPFIPKFLKSQITVPFPLRTLWKSSISIVIAIGVGFLVNFIFSFMSLIGIAVGALTLGGTYILSMLLFAGFDDEDFEMIFDSLKSFRLGPLEGVMKFAQKITHKSPFYKKITKVTDSEEEEEK